VENECSSHFSACAHLGLPIAAALEVSWRCDQIVALLEKHEDIRTEAQQKEVHKKEVDCIEKAVYYLLGECCPNSPTRS